MDRQALARALRQAREQRGFHSARAFARQAGISHSMISRVEKMEEDPVADTSRDPSLSTLEAWADACDLRLDFVLRPKAATAELVELSPSAAAIGRSVELLDEGQQALVRGIVDRLPSLKDEERDVLLGILRILKAEPELASERLDRRVR
jgi:transcriptional regulator with XRE-family HTH domain